MFYGKKQRLSFNWLVCYMQKQHWFIPWVTVGAFSQSSMLILPAAAAPLIPVPQQCPDVPPCCELGYLYSSPFHFLPAGGVKRYGFVRVLKATLSRISTQTHKAKQLELCER